MANRMNSTGGLKGLLHKLDTLLKCDTHVTDFKSRRAGGNVCELEQMKAETSLKRDNKRTKFIQSYKESVESHDRQRPEETRHLEEDTLAQ